MRKQTMTNEASQNNTRMPPVLTMTLNPALDIFVHVNELHPGELHRASGFNRNPGGKGINVSKALHAFGVPVLASGFLGGFNGDWIERQLSEQGISTRFVRTSVETRMNIKAVESEGKLTEFNSPSPFLSPDDWKRFDDLFESVSGNSSWVAFCGNLPEDCSPDWYQKAVERCHRHGVKTVVDTSGEALKHAVEAKPYFIKPNLEELQELAQKRLTTLKEVVAVARELVVSGISVVAVTMGSKGMVVAHEDDIFVVTVPEVEVISPVGAGDAVVAGFLHGFYHQHVFTEMVRFAAACGVAAVMKEGTAQPESADITLLLSKINIKKWEG